MFEISEIKTVRRKLGMTQHGFAKVTGVSQSMIAKIESGRLDPSYSKARQITEAIERLVNHKQQMAKEIMNPKVISVQAQDSILDAVKLMEETGISQFPVFDNDALVGTVSEKSILTKISQGKDLSKIRLRHVMDTPPPVIDGGTQIDVILPLLKFFHLILITEKGGYKGVITRVDMLEKVIGH